MNTSTLRLAAVTATAVAVTAVAAAAVTAAVTGDDGTLSAQDVDQLLAGQTASPSTTDGTPAPSGTASADGTGAWVFTVTPGTVTLRCDGNLVTLLSWSPNPGYRSDDPVRGPASMVSVRFESDTYADYKVTATCADTVVTLHEGPDDDDHGGRDDDPTDDHGGNRGPGGGD